MLQFSQQKISIHTAAGTGFSVGLFTWGSLLNEWALLYFVDFLDMDRCGNVLVAGRTSQPLEAVSLIASIPSVYFVGSLTVRSQCLSGGLSIITG